MEVLLFRWRITAEVLITKKLSIRILLIEAWD